MKRAGFWLRFAAAVIDLITILAALIAVEFGLLYTEPVIFGIDVAYNERASDFVSLMFVLAYSSFEIWLRGTPGKLLLRMAISRADGSPADFWRLFLRWSTKWSPIVCAALFALTGLPIFYFLQGILSLFVLIGLVPIFGDDKRSWHDEWSGTAVYRRLPIAHGFPVAPVESASNR